MHHSILTPRSYRDRAAECERLADAATDMEIRDTMTYLADLWRAMADQDEAARDPHTVPTSSLSASR
jgi:hypothetical protein